MRFAHFFVDRPIFASVTSIVLLIVGYVAFSTLPVAQYPDIVPPTVVVRASYPGANAETVAATIATPIEQEINGVDNMLYMSSLSTNDGNMQLTVTFKLGTDLDKAPTCSSRTACRRRASPRLPDRSAPDLGVTTRKNSPDLLMVVHLLSPDNTYDQNFTCQQLRAICRSCDDRLLRLARRWRRSPMFGAQRLRACGIWLDPDKYRRATASTAGGRGQRRCVEQNVQVASGGLVERQPPVPTNRAFQPSRAPSRGGSWSIGLESRRRSSSRPATRAASCAIERRGDG